MCVPEYLSLESVTATPQDPELKPVGIPHSGWRRGREPLGDYRCCLASRMNAAAAHWGRAVLALAGGRKQALTQAALFYGFRGGQQPKETLSGWDPSHTVSHQTRNHEAWRRSRPPSVPGTPKGLSVHLS